MRATALAILMALGATTAAMAAPGKERLVTAPYPGPPAWKEITNKSNGSQFYREQIPGNQTVANFTDILTSQNFPQQRGADPSAFLRGVFQAAAGDCDGLRVNGPTARQEGGYPVAYAQVYCGLQKGKPYGVNIFFKAISGDDALYSVERDVHVPASATGGVQGFSKDQMAQMTASLNDQKVANDYLVRSVYVCGAKATDKRCK
jgi:hypothetical protein